MATARAEGLLAASPERLWEIVSDPYHLPRWWPRVERVEGVERGAFTEVMRSRRGNVVRADFDVTERDAATRRMVWEQRIPGTPFERLLRSSRTTVSLAPTERGTNVQLELVQKPAGALPSFGSLLVRRAARATLHGALAGLERLVG